MLLSKAFALGNLIMSPTTAANITWRFSRCTHLAKPGSSMLKSLLSLAVQSPSQWSFALPSSEGSAPQAVLNKAWIPYSGSAVMVHMLGWANGLLTVTRGRWILPNSLLCTAQGLDNICQMQNFCFHLTFTKSELTQDWPFLREAFLGYALRFQNFLKGSSVQEVILDWSFQDKNSWLGFSLNA